jgi:GT2 family glycosyltransferase/glycosyltransferase involved in cell wall biosynthesis
MNFKHLWLAYVSYPVTTAAYFERAFRKLMKVTTLGPKIDEFVIESWNLQNMKLPVVDHDIPLPYEYDLETLYHQTPESERPDCFLWIESVYGHFPKNIHKLPCPRICYLIDSHISLTWHLEWAKQFDLVFIAQREYLPAFQGAGIQNVHWLPLGCDPEIHTKTTTEKEYEVGFVGSIVEGHPRSLLLEKIKSSFHLHVRRCFWKEMADVFSKSKIVFNNCVRNDLNMRVFEAMSTGSLLLTDDPGLASGLTELFTPGEDFVLYHPDNLVEQIAYYLKNDQEREAIAKSGREKVLAAHTYAHRAQALLDVVFCQTISPPDAREWRDQSLGLPNSYFMGENPWRGAILPSRPQRSFVIPVLDKSPASPYNIETLLKDLEGVDGNVIVVFNSEKMAAAYAKHPRVTLSATLSQNVGVARAWNTGIHLSETPTVFILNADLHLRPKSIPLIERTLQRIDRAAVAGPQGSFFNFFGSIDYQYFDKGTSPRPLQVDAISGFFFAVKRALFSERDLLFEDDYSPCYFEEWDLGLQCREKGWECWIAPTTEYDHEWSGTIKANKVVGYFDHRESIFDIHARNTKRFQKKWLERSQKLNNPKLLLSRYPEYLLTLAQESQERGDLEGAEAFRQKSMNLVRHFERCFGGS